MDFAWARLEGALGAHFQACFYGSGTLLQVFQLELDRGRREVRDLGR
jgi:hypothetical protein